MSEPRDRYAPRPEPRPSRAREGAPDRPEPARERFARSREERDRPGQDWDPERDRFRDVEGDDDPARRRRIEDERAFERRGRDMRDAGDPYGAGPEWPPPPTSWRRADVGQGIGYDPGISWPREPRPGYTRDWGLERDDERRRQEFREGPARGTPFGSFAASDDYGDAFRQGAGEPQARESYAGRGPKGYQRTDARILEEVSDRLYDDPRVDASDIEVNVNEGEVTLAGRVRTRMEKWRAESVAASVRGVRDVENRLRVQAG